MHEKKIQTLKKGSECQGRLRKENKNVRKMESDWR